MSIRTWPRPTRHFGVIDRKAREHFVYWIYDADDACLYVGRTCQPELRWYQHQRTNPQMAGRATRFRMAGPYAIDVAARIELDQQLLLKPPFGCSRLQVAS